MLDYDTKRCFNILELVARDTGRFVQKTYNQRGPGLKPGSLD